jgi:hypothetical protein
METKLQFTGKETKSIQIVAQELDIDKFDHKNLPSDVHVVTYNIGDTTYYDAVRAYTMVDIFDAYYDKLKDTGTVSKIKSGYGTIRPNLYGKIKNEEE